MPIYRHPRYVLPRMTEHQCDDARKVLAWAILTITRPGAVRPAELADVDVNAVVGVLGILSAAVMDGEE